MPRSFRRHPVLWALAVAASLGAGALAWQRARGALVEVVTPRRSPLVQTVVSSGRVRPQRLQLSPLVTGRVVAVPVHEGQTVEAGALLLQLDDREAAARVSEAEAALLRTRAERRTVGTLQLEQAQEVLTQAQARAEEARRDVQRLEGLARQGAVATKTFEQARTALEVNESALRDAQLQRASLDKRGVRVQSAAAAVQQAEASLSLARAHLDYCRITAPLAGVVLALDVRVGDVVQAGQTVLELSASGGTELVTELDERNLALLRPEQTALASAEAYPDQRFPARVSFIAPAIDPGRGTVEVRLVVDDAPDYLRPDMTVSIDIEVARRDDALTLPVAAVRDLAGDPYVLTARDGIALRRGVRVGIRDDARVELRDPMDVDTPVILDRGVQPGDRVRRGSRAP